MDLGTVMSVVQTLFAALQCKELKEIYSLLGYKTRLDALQGTVSVIQAVLRDAETKEPKEELHHQAQLWIQELKDAVYDADDLLDEFVTLAKQKQLIKGEKVSKKMRRFFSRNNTLGVAYRMSQGVKKIRKKLEAVAKDHADFGFKVDCQPIRRRRKETCSYVYDNNIIGREDDVQKILAHMFDDSAVRQHVSVLAVVGIGGLGKTALAQLLYNDARVTSAFPLKLWTCVSDCEQEELDVQLILRKILAAATGQKHEGSTKDFLQIQLRERLTSNKYLLVLDDVWTESRIQWLELEDFLMGGQRGSWILVTTRSHNTARIVKSGLTHKLQGLSRENSLRLFKIIAFGSEQSNPPDVLVKIGEEIVEGCAGVPLAIKVAGSLLYGQQDKNKWLSFKETGLSKHREGQKNIFSILEFSYHQLESPLKSCFTYCALFSKDVVIRKDILISLWMANEFIVPLDDSQKIEDAAEEYYSILLRRCFFQDVKLDKYGEILSCKIHDLMHDVAQKIAGREICMSNFVNDDVLNKPRHLGYMDHVRLSSSNLSNTRIRSYLCSEPQMFRDLKMEQACLEALVANWMRLRVLDLQGSCIATLPESTGELLHLRYLDLSRNSGLEVLPNTISKLCNLQTLNLQHCQQLKELPKDFKKLVNLRALDIYGCDGLSNMPEGISKLTRLQVLTWFVIDGSNISRKQWCNQLGELGKLDSLRGKLEVRIKVGENSINVRKDGIRKGEYLRGKQHLNGLDIKFLEGGYEEGTVRLLEELQPHPNLKSLELRGYNDPMMRMPAWASSLATFLPNLIYVRVEDSNVECLSCLANLLHLKELHLCWLEKLEYINEDMGVVASSNETTTRMPHGLPSAQGFVLFPCLQTLELWKLPKLKGWRNSRVGVGDNKQQHDTGSMARVSFPRLKSLKIRFCPELICILQCPNLKELHLWEFNRNLQVVILGNTIHDVKKEASTPSSPSYDISKLREVHIDNVSWLNSFPKEAFQCLSEIGIEFSEVESLREAEEVFRGCSSSLQTLEIGGCPKLKRVWSGGLEHLIALEFLHIRGFNNASLLLLGEEEREDRISISRLPRLNSLRTLGLPSHQQLADLEKWIPFLVALQSLKIYNCDGLESLPHWMPKLTSLRELHLQFCSESLKERCKHTTSQDWPYIQHTTIKFYP